MQSSSDIEVLIVGAGPVGLTAAMDLASRDISVMVIEQRSFGEPPPVKCNHISSRTMEQFRRLGVATKLRSAGLPEDYPNDVVFRTSMTGIELTRIPIPCRRDRFTSKEGPDTGWPTPEPPHRINQIYLEPILFDHVTKNPKVQICNRVRLLDVKQGKDVVHARVLDIDKGIERVVSAHYLIGCDGGSSTIRKQIDARLEGTAVIQRVQSTCIRAPELKSLLPGKAAWCYYSINPRRCGTVFAIDGEEIWLIHNHLNSDESDFDAVDRNESIRDILGVDRDFQYDLISKEDWVGRRLVSNKFREGNIFIAGDAAHIWVPYAGYGMNAGIADVLNLSWLLSARLKGWAEETILDAYEAERLPITEQVSYFVMDHAHKMMQARSAVPPNIEAKDQAGEDERKRIGREAYALNVQQFCCAGLNYGYFYKNSPIIAHDSEAPPSYSMGAFSPSTVPGCRTPHFWLDDNRSLYDALGPDYTLIRFDDQTNVDSFMDLASNYGIPIKILNIKNKPSTYNHSFIICRSDQHIVWRGNSLTDNTERIISMLRGKLVGTDGPHLDIN